MTGDRGLWQQLAAGQATMPAGLPNNVLVQVRAAIQRRRQMAYWCHLTAPVSWQPHYPAAGCPRIVQQPTRSDRRHP